MYSMKNNRIAPITRVLLLVCSVGLIIVLFTPIWRIDLQAPQYPEGLKLFIYANKLAGNIDIINGLNHYIGMKSLHASDFPEFKILPGIIIFFTLFFFLTAVIARRMWLNILCALFVAFGILAMVDFWRWEYDYGHNLNPAAAIIVPGMAYQPPLLGFKQLLNFGAYSIPAIGGWIFLSAGIVLLYCVIFEWRRIKKLVIPVKAIPLVAIGLLTLLLNSCSNAPQPLKMGRDNCDFCKMALSDNRFGAEIVSKKNKVYKFDDEHCIISFLHSKNIAPEQIGEIYFVNFSMPHELINVEHALFLQSPSFKSPMNGNIAAFNNEDSLVSVLPIFKGNKISWEDMQK
jgi:copper chaperone NosL